MLKARLAAASEVNDVLIPAENAIDDAFQKLAVLLNTMCMARASANLPLQTGKTEYQLVAEAVSFIGQARGNILAAHEAFVKTRAEVLPTVCWGDVAQCPPATAGSLREAEILPLGRAA